MLRPGKPYNEKRRPQVAVAPNAVWQDHKGASQLQGLPEGGRIALLQEDEIDDVEGSDYPAAAALFTTMMPREGALTTSPIRTSTSAPSSVTASPQRRALSPDSCNIRRSNKPLMEKKRRQRINRCLNELKSLVFEAMKRDPTSYSKLEKADILEMTVRHVQVLHRQEQQLKTFFKSDEGAKYRAGFVHATKEVTQYLGNLIDVPTDLHQKVLKHLNNVATSNESNTNGNITNVQNSVHVANPSQQPIILILNSQPQVHTAVNTTVPITQVSAAPSMTIPQLPVNQGTVQFVKIQEGVGNSLGAQPNVLIMPQQQVKNQIKYDYNKNVQLSNSLSMIPTSSNSGPMTLVLPTVSNQINNTENRIKLQNSYYCPIEKEISLQDEAPVLASILKAAKQRKSSQFSKRHSFSSSSSDYQNSSDSEENSDIDMNSQISSPASFMSMSPVPDENISPSASPSFDKSAFSPIHSNVFREELGSSIGALKYNSSKRYPILAPKIVPSISLCASDITIKDKITCKAHKQTFRTESQVSNIYENKCPPELPPAPNHLLPMPPREFNDTAADMWRPW